MTSADPVAVLGAGGMMGLPMARNLARAGIDVRAWDRTRAKAEPLAADGVQIFDTPAQAAHGAGVVLTMLADADVVIASMDGDQGALSAARDSTVWVQMSTIGEAGTERCAKLAQDRGVAFVDAPVLGTRQPAEQGQLVVFASGPNELQQRVQPIFDAVGQRTMWVGEAGAGTRLKLVTNFWLVVVVEGGAETIALAEGLGLDPALLFEAIEGGALDLPYLRMKAKSMLERSFEPSFRLGLAAKDAGLVEEAAKRHGLDLPLASVIHARMEQGAREHGHEDLSATFLTSAPA
jgi:3-hydroxyisobutyrate dehydrogenase